jgi:hypothetical protein
MYAVHEPSIVVALEIIGAEKQEHTPARLIADKRLLFGPGCACKKQGRSDAARRRDHDPALVLLWLVAVLNERKLQFVGVKVYSLVIVTNDQRDVSN